jgi:hypothetical protein
MVGLGSLDVVHRTLQRRSLWHHFVIEQKIIGGAKVF